MRTRGWLDGYYDSAADGVLVESIRFHEGVDDLTELYVEDMEMLRELGL